MRLRNELSVGVPPEHAWAALLDLPRVARALPGAAIGDEPDGGAWRATVKVALGPVTTEYAGSARVLDADEDDRVVSYRVDGREARGHGTAAATITARLAGDGGGTRVIVETDLRVTGRQAQLGHGLIEDVAGAVLSDFAGRLERELGGALGPRRERAALVLAAVVAGLALVRVVWRR